MKNIPQTQKGLYEKCLSIFVLSVMFILFIAYSTIKPDPKHVYSPGLTETWDAVTFQSNFYFVLISIDPIPVPALVLDCIGIGIDITWYRYRINTIICKIAKH